MSLGLLSLEGDVAMQCCTLLTSTDAHRLLARMQHVISMVLCRWLPHAHQPARHRGGRHSHCHADSALVPHWHLLWLLCMRTLAL